MKRLKTRQNYLKMVTSLSEYQLKREVPVYKQAFPKLFDSEIKALNLNK